MNILITGAAGFIGFHVSKRMMELGYNVIGIDNLNDYYDPNLKLARLKELGIIELGDDIFYMKSNVSRNFIFLKADIEDDNLWDFLSKTFEIDFIIHLAAQAGVRYSLENPKAYIKSNIEGFLNVLEFCRYNKKTNFIYASSSSVYGLDSKQPFSEDEECNKPISLYAATKRSNELMAYTYHHLYGINSIGLRFFTVYGPWGRPDMAPFLFANAAFARTPIKLYNYGRQERDFTFISDIVNGITNVFNKRANIKGAEIVNIGNGQPIKLLYFVSLIEKFSNNKISKEFISDQPGDVTTTYADTNKLCKNFDYTTEVTIEDGLKEFIEWYSTYFYKTTSI